ncbi:MAG: helix-turn-helix transcriptional regulator [Bacteroidetes bacterium]|nr:helix-turn-helix transcriptional regulator [Bacteroidota bacterium]
MATAKEKAFLVKVGNNIVRIRKEKGISSKELAEHLDMEPSNLTPIEKGRINTTLLTLHKIAQILGVDVSEFMD